MADMWSEVKVNDWSRRFSGIHHDIVVERFTENSVWIKGRRCKIDSRYGEYFQSRDVAVEFAREIIHKELKRINERERWLCDRLGELDD